MSEKRAMTTKEPSAEPEPAREVVTKDNTRWAPCSLKKKKSQTGDGEALDVGGSLPHKQPSAEPEEWCPASTSDWFCTLKPGHTGRHEAWSETMPINTPFHSWTDAEPSAKPVDFEAAAIFALDCLGPGPQFGTGGAENLARACLALRAEVERLAKDLDAIRAARRKQMEKTDE